MASLYFPTASTESLSYKPPMQGSPARVRDSAAAHNEAHADHRARDKRNAFLSALELVPSGARIPQEDPKRPWKPMAPVFNQKGWKQVTSVLFQYINNGQPDENRAEACRRVEKAMMDPDSRNKLDLSNLGLREAPPILANVVELNMSGNRLTELPPLPCTIKRLFLARNRLKTLNVPLPPGLTILNVAYNELSALPETLPDSLGTLQANGNALQALPGSMPYALQTIDVCGNRGPNLVSAAARMLIELQRHRRAPEMPIQALMDRGHRSQAGKQCDSAMKTHLQRLLPTSRPVNQ